MEGGLGEDRLAGEQRSFNLLCHRSRPAVVRVVAIGEGEQKAGVSDAFHLREKPLRRERSAGPSTAPARLMKAWSLSLDSDFARSNCSRTIRPAGMPVRRATC